VRIKAVLSLLCVVAMAIGAWYLVNTLDKRSVSSVELVLAALAVGAVAARWWIVARRRQRQKLQELRDSALW
jgi:predicted MFS family arabinose efflux permease